MDLHDLHSTADPAGAAVAHPHAQWSVAGGNDHDATAIELLSRALAIAQTVVQRSEHRYLAALCDHVPALAASGLEHAHAARIDVVRIGARLAELAGESEGADPTPPPARSTDTGEVQSAPSLAAMVGAHVATERDAVAAYREIGTLLAAFDRASGALIDAVAAGAERRADELAGLQERVPKY